MLCCTEIFLLIVKYLLYINKEITVDTLAKVRTTEAVDHHCPKIRFHGPHTLLNFASTVCLVYLVCYTCEDRDGNIDEHKGNIHHTRLSPDV